VSLVSLRAVIVTESVQALVRAPVLVVRLRFYGRMVAVLK